MKKKIRNIYDETFDDFYTEIRNSRERLIGAVQRVITRKGVIDIYPDGPDKEKAIKDCEQAKYSLICAIGNYDGRFNEIKQYYNQNLDKFTENWFNPNNFSSSHEIVEMTYSNYFKSRG